MMSNGDRGQSVRIWALDTQKPQQKDSQNLNEGKKAGSTKDHQTNAAVMPSGSPLPERSKLRLLLDKLKRRDRHCIFSEPVNGEEVKYYYEVIKQPMDFGMISAKLHRGSYKSLQEFERDVTLVWSNAMVFNKSSTIYYKQARAIRDLAKQLFSSLKTDPDNFVEVPKSGGRGRRKSRYTELDRRCTYRPPNSPNTLLNENKSIVSTVCLSPQELVQSKQIGYTESLLQFVKDLGPTANRVASRKLQQSAEEADHVERILADTDIESFCFMDALCGDTNTILGRTPVRNMPGHDWKLFRPIEAPSPVRNMPDQDWELFKPMEAPSQPFSSRLFPPQTSAGLSKWQDSGASTSWKLFRPIEAPSPVRNMPDQDWKLFRPMEAPSQPISSRMFPPQTTSAGPSKWQDNGASTSYLKPITLSDIDEWLRNH